ARPTCPPVTVGGLSPVSPIRAALGLRTTSPQRTVRGFSDTARCDELSWAPPSGAAGAAGAAGAPAPPGAAARQVSAARQRAARQGSSSLAGRRRPTAPATGAHRRPAAG